MLKAGVVGAGRGHSFVAVMSRLPEFQVTAVCDRQESLAADLAERYQVPRVHSDFAAFLEEDLDVVVVATPPEFHVPQSVAALERGCHVLSEVPAANRLEECPRLAQAALAGPGKYMLAENCNYWAFLETWREIARQGRLGKVLYAEAEYIHSLPSLRRTPEGKPTWRAFIPPIHYCTHSLGPLLALEGDRVVRAVGMSTGSHVDPEFGSIDLEVGLFYTASGAVIKILCGFSLVREPAFHYYSVYGSKGCLETTRGTPDPFGTTLAYFDDVPHLRNMIRIPVDTQHSNVPHWAHELGHGTAEYAMLRAFADSILQDTPPPIDVRRALEMSVPGLVAHQSALQGGELREVPEFMG
jgi:predicted dehydrogenase